jgi:Glycine zipper
MRSMGGVGIKELKVLNRTGIGLLSLLVLATLAPINSFADDLFIYPAKGQSAEQQDKDKWECRSWATKQTGFDPASRITASTPPPTRQAPKGGVIRGAAGGAAIGAVGGAIGGNAGKGAAIGAGAGGLLGAVRRNNQVRDEQYAHQQWAQQNVAQYEQNRSSWIRAVKACLTGRGYTVQ